MHKILLWLVFCFVELCFCCRYDQFMYYYPYTADQSSACKTTPVGYYSFSLYAWRCPDGTTSDSPGYLAPNCAYDQGSCQNSVCRSICQAGSYIVPRICNGVCDVPFEVCYKCSVWIIPASCKLCAPGSFSAQTESKNCTLCPLNTFASALGSSFCTNCSVGTYSSVLGATTCMGCFPGTFTQNVSECANCSAGTFSSALGMSACSICPPGTFASGAGATVCANCSAGTYASSSNSTSCLGCAAGTFSSAAGLSGCSTCAQGIVYRVVDKTYA